MICARAGCSRKALADEFCSTKCAKIHFGQELPPSETKSERRNRLRRVRYWKKKFGGDFAKVTNPDALEHRLLGSYGSGKRR